MRATLALNGLNIFKTIFVKLVQKNTLMCTCSWIGKWLNEREFQGRKIVQISDVFKLWWVSTYKDSSSQSSRNFWILQVGNWIFWLIKLITNLHFNVFNGISWLKMLWKIFDLKIGEPCVIDIKMFPDKLRIMWLPSVASEPIQIIILKLCPILKLEVFTSKAPWIKKVGMVTSLFLFPGSVKCSFCLWGTHQFCVQSFYGCKFQLKLYTRLLYTLTISRKKCVL